MTKNDLINNLTQIPGNPKVCVVDVMKNLNGADDGENNYSDGVYSELDVEHMTGLKVPAEAKDFISIGFVTKNV